MLFTTALFVFCFLPITLAGFFALGRYRGSLAIGWLFAASVIFYAYWMPKFTALLLASILSNYAFGSLIGRRVNAGLRPAAKRWLIVGVTINLALLAYFKYFNFFLDNLNVAFDLGFNFERVILPIGISFFTFTQIAYLADTYLKGLREYQFAHYGLFVTYFPHLIAGPVLHHAQMMPQFAHNDTFKINGANLTAGLAIFMLGLFKKIVIADGISPYADAVFNGADAALTPTAIEAWLGALAYTFQLYFDFSGYSDMAIGLSWMFNIRLPFNFDSPYKSINISEFWRRWHISLSTFLRDYLYVPLGGNRRGEGRRYGNLAITMILGGLWHGASWTFVLWGTLHGVYLCIHHAYRALVGKLRPHPSAVERAAYLLLTFLAALVAWVFFRATTFSGSLGILSAMCDLPGVFQPPAVHPLLWNAGLHWGDGLVACAILVPVCWFVPNSNQIGERIRQWSGTRPKARHLLGGFTVAMAVLLILINALRASVSSFIYFNF